MVLIISPWVINAECFDLREVPLCQAVGIRKEVAPCFTTLLQILNFDKAGQAAFLTAPTVVILLKSMLSVMLHKYSYCRSGISTRAIPSMDWISLLPRFRVVRAGKLIWAISFTPVALLSTISAITYRSQALSLPIDWWTVAEGRLLPSTFENLNEIALTYFHNPFLLQRFSLRNHNLLSSYFYFSAAFIIFFSVFKANRMKDHLHILKSFMLAKLFFENIKLKKQTLHIKNKSIFKHLSSSYIFVYFPVKSNLSNIPLTKNGNKSTLRVFFSKIEKQGHDVHRYSRDAWTLKWKEPGKSAFASPEMIQIEPFKKGKNLFKIHQE